MRLLQSKHQLDLGGAVVGVLAVLVSLTPSLLPRPSWAQGLVCGLAFAVGYGVGVGMWRLAARVSRGRMRPHAETAWWLVTAIGLAGVLALMPLAVRWQNSVREAVGEPPTSGFDWFIGAIFYAVGVTLAFSIGRGVARGWRALHRLSLRWVPGDRSRRRIRLLDGAVTLVAMLVVASAAISVLSWLLTVVSVQRNRAYDPLFPQPTSELRSGSDASLVAWDQVGQAGAKIVGGGPDAAQIEAVTGVPAEEPIRVYVGIDVPGTFEERAQVAVAELDRTGAADRSVLMIAGTTGSGWLDPAAIDGFEYLHAGDTAIVAQQYGATGSPVSALLTPDLSQDGTTALVEAVTDWWAGLPEADRPQLIVYGLSLGSFGIQSAYDSGDDLLVRTEGAVLAGTPSFTPVWSAYQDTRDPGSPYSLPVLDDGEHVRWADEWGGLEALGEPWQETRVAYLQHGTDPIVWIGPSVIWSEPEWLKPGQRSPDISDDMTWIPVVTAFQGVIDLILSTAVPEDAGHKYGNLAVDGLHEVSGDAGLDEQALERVRTLIETYDTYVVE
ncbi:alpha/beta-hydrolase family protein [Demequina sp. NBRC 110053]|uniref:alpha/beta-hydrolase family protein n=1 Tax=Demequina sp. NBRC 110053 TaxID=1570342 RepID=UPI001356519E|nr:alpha/beta-hydrolase family protein [Demequina sp. NBRC 110053]